MRLPEKIGLFGNIGKLMKLVRFMWTPPPPEFGSECHYQNRSEVGTLGSEGPEAKNQGKHSHLFTYIVTSINTA